MNHRQPTLRTRTIAPLNSLDQDWLDEPSVAWLRDGEGILGWGIAARAHFRGAERFSRAQRWAQEQLADTRIEDGVGLARIAPIAFSSFTFDDESEGSVVVIPRTVVGLRGGISWRTDLVMPKDSDEVRDAGTSGIADLLGGAHEWMPAVTWHDDEADDAWPTMHGVNLTTNSCKSPPEGGFVTLA